MPRFAPAGSNQGGHYELQSAQVWVPGGSQQVWVPGRCFQQGWQQQCTAGSYQYVQSAGRYEVQQSWVWVVDYRPAYQPRYEVRVQGGRGWGRSGHHGGMRHF